MPSNAEISEALQRAVDQIEQAVQGVSDPIVLIDGRSGSGKSTVAHALSTRLGGTLLALDSVYPGWDGLASGADSVIRHVVEPISRGERGEWTGWDWEADGPADSHDVEPGGALIVEGVGIVTPVSAAHADVSVWLESPRESRRSRALLRDGDAYRPHWTRWAAQEDVHIESHAPRSLATLVFEVP